MIYEHGFRFFDGEVLQEVAWDEIQSFVAQYVRGVRKKGTDDETNMVMVIVECPGKLVRLPAELEGFRALRAELSQHTDAPWRQTLVANLRQRG